MTSNLLRNISAILIKVPGQQSRFAYVTHGRHPAYAKSLKERLAELKYKDPNIYYDVDIGMPLTKDPEKKIPTILMRLASKNNKNPELEKKSRLRELVVDLEDVREEWLKIEGPKRLKTIATHYGIFQDLYGEAYFHPVVRLQVDYDFNDPEYLARVYCGNVLKPKETQNKPIVSYPAEEGSLYTLLLTTPDGVLAPSAKESCHWFMGNIPGNDLEKGEQLVDYLQPIPSRGIGYCRYIFILYKQDKHIDFSEYKQDQPCLELVKRAWNTYDFYRKHQNAMTPVGLSFFQCDWDQTLTDFFHQTLNMREPSFEYDFPKPYQAPQRWYPKKQPFNLYMDKYRDPKAINREFLVEKLKKTHPFKGPEPPLKYPNAHWIDHRSMPSWLITKIEKDRLGIGRINEIEEEPL